MQRELRSSLTSSDAREWGSWWLLERKQARAGYKWDVPRAQHWRSPRAGHSIRPEFAPTMKLTPELLAQASSALNPVKERQLDLRGRSTKKSM
jgi:hypothetical protein